MPRARPVLTEDQRINLSGACLATAIDTLGDARGLLNSNALARGTFLLIVSLEEMCKARYCLHAEAESWSKWWDGFRDHKTKMAEIVRYAPDVPKDQLGQLLTLRERCLYADVSPAGDPLTPRGIVDPGGLDRDMMLGFSKWVEDAIGRTLEELKPPRNFTPPTVPG